MIKKSLLILLAACLALAGCQAAPAPGGAQAPGLKVIAIESFLADMAQNVAGSRLQVDALIPTGLDPHAFEPAPQDVAKLAEAGVILANGAGFETWLDKALANSGGKAPVIEASAGLTPRNAREGELAVMSDADLADSMCASAAGEQPQPATASPDTARAAALPGESGLFQVQLSPGADGSFGGSLLYSSDESGDFQLAVSAGRLELLPQAGGSPLAPKKTLSLACQGLAQASLVSIQKQTPYLLTLSGLPAAQALLLVGPAGGVHRHDLDPHFWLDPNNAVRYVEAIRAGLAAADPAGAAEYAANAAAYTRQLQELDAWIQAQVAPLPPERRLLVTNHESLGYFADRYGFRIIGTVVPSVSSEASPSAQQLARLVDRIRSTGVAAIFLETGANPQLAEQVGRETGVKVVSGLFTHSLTPPGGQAPTYIDMLKFDVTAIVTALK